MVFNITAIQLRVRIIYKVEVVCIGSSGVALRWAEELRDALQLMENNLVSAFQPARLQFTLALDRDHASYDEPVVRHILQEWDRVRADLNFAREAVTFHPTGGVHRITKAEN